jgi:hypothetical protein
VLALAYVVVQYSAGKVRRCSCKTSTLHTSKHSCKEFKAALPKFNFRYVSEQPLHAHLLAAAKRLIELH